MNSTLKKYIITVIGLVIVMAITMIILAYLYDEKTAGDLKASAIVVFKILSHPRGFLGVMLLPLILISSVFVVRVWAGMSYFSVILFTAMVILFLKVIGIYDILAEFDITGIGPWMVQVVGALYGFCIFVFPIGRDKNDY